MVSSIDPAITKKIINALEKDKQNDIGSSYDSEEHQDLKNDSNSAKIPKFNIEEYEAQRN